MADPFVSIVIVNWNGRAHLESCLPSVTTQDYPHDRYEVVVVDNGSRDDSVRWMRETHPAVKVIEYQQNLGIAGAYAAAIPETRGDALALLNNDTRVEAGWLRELTRAADEERAAVVASKMLDWTGERIDFVGGIVSLLGHCWQIAQGQPRDAAGCTRAPLLFACGGAMLVDRGAYEAAGGFDPAYFAYLEDVDLGWRLSARGYRTVLAPEAVVFHRLHGTGGRTAFAPRLRLYERNALFTIFKCFEQATLDRVLPAAIALTLARGLGPTAIDRGRFAFGASMPASFETSPQTVATLMALEDFVRALPRLREQRTAIESGRRCGDRELSALFVDPLRLHERDAAYAQLARHLYDEFGLFDLVSGWRGASAKPSASSVGATSSSSGQTPEAAAADPAIDASIVILTALGPLHLDECLGSLAALDFPADRVEVLVVDNGSREDPTATVAARYPGARVIRLGENTGFCAGNNAGARAARGRWVLFLNDDTRASPGLLTELFATADRRGCGCVGALVLDWSGQRIDFAGGALNFEGKGFQVGYNSTDLATFGEERPLFFANGAALFVRRDLFLAVGGFDEALFAYYEDVALGWRLTLMKAGVWLSPAAIVYHKHHGTSGQWPSAPRVFLMERNGLRTLFQHLSPESLRRLLPAVLLLASERTLMALGRGYDDDGPGVVYASRARRLYWRAKPRTLWRHLKSTLVAADQGRPGSKIERLRRIGAFGLVRACLDTLRFVVREVDERVLRRAAYLLERRAPDKSFDTIMEQASPEAGAMLAALAAWLDDIGQARQRRAEVQSTRVRTDADILEGMRAYWTAPPSVRNQLPYNDLHAIVVDAFNVGAVLDSKPSHAAAPVSP